MCFFTKTEIQLTPHITEPQDKNFSLCMDNLSTFLHIIVSYKNVLIAKMVIRVITLQFSSLQPVVSISLLVTV